MLALLLLLVTAAPVPTWAFPLRPVAVGDEFLMLRGFDHVRVRVTAVEGWDRGRVVTYSADYGVTVGRAPEYLVRQWVGRRTVPPNNLRPVWGWGDY